MKKALFVAIFLALSFSNVARAQTVSTIDLDNLKSQLIALLTQEVASLQAQLKDLVAQQATQSQQISQIQEQINTPVVTSAPMTASLVQAVTPTTISIGPIDCHGASGQLGEYGVTVPVTIAGDYKTWKINYDAVKKMSDGNGVDTYYINRPRVTDNLEASQQDRSGKYTLSGIMPNISTTYHMTAHAYDSTGNEVATSGEQIVTVDCPASPYFTIR